MQEDTYRTLQQVARVRGWDLGQVVAALLDEVVRLEHPSLLPVFMGLHQLMVDHGLNTLQMAYILRDHHITPGNLSDYSQFSQVCSEALLVFVREHFFVNPEHWQGKATRITWGSRWGQDQYLMGILMDSMALGEQPRVYFVRSESPHRQDKEDRQPWMVSVIVERQHPLAGGQERYCTYQMAGSGQWSDPEQLTALAQLAARLHCLQDICKQRNLGYQNVHVLHGQEVPYNLHLRCMLGSIHPARLAHQWDAGEWNPVEALPVRHDEDWTEMLRHKLICTSVTRPPRGMAGDNRRTARKESSVARFAEKQNSTNLWFCRAWGAACRMLKVPLEPNMVKPFFTNSDYKEQYYSTFDLKSRGWTVTMIAKLLPEHDAEKENHMQYQGHSGKRKIAHPVKLYEQDRVKLLEDTEAFFECYERAQRALQRGEKRSQTVRAQKQNLIDSVLASYHPEVKPEEGWEKNLQAFQPVYAAAVELWWDGHVRGEMLEGACKALVERFQQAYLKASQEWESSKKKPRSSRRKTLGKAS